MPVHPSAVTADSTHPAPGSGDALHDATWDLSTWAACVCWEEGDNDAGWLDGLRDRILRVQDLIGTGRGMRSATAGQVVRSREMQG